VLLITATLLVNKECIKDGHVSEVGKNIYLSTYKFSRQFPNCSPFCLICLQTHVSITFLCYMRFDSMARFISGFAFNNGSMHVCESVHITLVFPVNNP
jgi:hypothetical protein